MARFSSRAPSLYFPFKIYPLRVLKQILCIFFATCDEGMRQRYPELVRFVLNKHSSGMSPAIRIYAYYNPTGRVRQTGRVVRTTFGAREIDVVSEFSFRPWGYVLGETPARVDPRLVDLNPLAQFGYGDESIVSLRIPVLDVVTPFPGDYRNSSEVQADALRNMRGE
jgi:hypothetical protein